MKTLKFYSIVILALGALLYSHSSCEKDKKDPAITATKMTALSVDQYEVTAKITALGDYKILDHGFVFDFGTDEFQVEFLKKISLGSEIVADSFSGNLNNSEYFYDKHFKCYAKAYITNEKGTVFSNEISINIHPAELNSVSATHGFPGDTLTLYGNYFNSNPQLNSVLFNSTPATVISGTLTTLQVIVPYINGGGANNPVDISLAYWEVLENVYSYDFYVTGFSPHNGIWGTQIRIDGSFYNGVQVFLNDTYVETYFNNKEYLTVEVPENYLKKNSKLYIKSKNQVGEVPGGVFRIDDLVVDPLAKWEYNNEDIIVFSGQNFHPSRDYNVLLLVDGSALTSFYSSSSFAWFVIPTTINMGSYLAKITNGSDTITLPSQITIKGK